MQHEALNTEARNFKAMTEPNEQSPEEKLQSRDDIIKDHLKQQLAQLIQEKESMHIVHCRMLETRDKELVEHKKLISELLPIAEHAQFSASMSPLISDQYMESVIKEVIARAKALTNKTE